MSDAELDALVTELSQLSAMVIDHEAIDRAIRALDAIRAENARLREALEKIASGQLFQHAHVYARAALAEQEPI